MRRIMKRLTYQLKNLRKDKLCLLTFLLPIVVGIVINVLPAMNTQTLGEMSFGCVKNDLPAKTVRWLRENGTLTEYGTLGELETAVNDPATQMIGVLRSENGIRTLLSGDELKLYETTGKTLPRLYDNRMNKIAFSQTIVPIRSNYDGLKSLLIVITLVTAMFMGCTFTSMNIIGEKEDGVALVNQILPMGTGDYILQKLTLGFIGGCASTAICAFLCIRIAPAQIPPLFLLIVLSAYTASLVGLFVGHFSSGLMIGIVYIKLLMILFLAPPILFYLLVPTDNVVLPLSYLFQSSAAFYGLMDLLGGQTERLWLNLIILAIHAGLLSGIYFLVAAKKRKHQ